MNSKLKRNLTISLFVVLGVGLLISIILGTVSYFLKKKAMSTEIKPWHKKVIAETKLAFRNLDSRMTYFFESPYKIDDLEWIASTIKINNYKNIWLFGNNIETPLLLIQEAIKQNIHIDKNDISIKNWNEKVKQYPNLFSMTVNFLDNQTSNLDLIIFLQKNIKLKDIFNEYHKKLRSEGMIMVLLNRYSSDEIKILTNELKLKNIKFEISYAKKSKFLYIVKS